MAAHDTADGATPAAEAFAAAVATHLDGLYRYARLLTPSQAAAEDLVQDTVVRARTRGAVPR